MTAMLERELTARQRFGDFTDYSNVASLAERRLRKQIEEQKNSAAFQAIMDYLPYLDEGERDKVAAELRRLSPPVLITASNDGPFVPRKTLTVVAQMKAGNFHRKTYSDTDIFALASSLGPRDDGEDTQELVCDFNTTQEVDMAPYLEDEYYGDGVTAITEDEMAELANWAKYAGGDDGETHGRLARIHDWWDGIWNNRAEYTAYVKGYLPNRYESDRPQFLRTDYQPDAPGETKWGWVDTGYYPQPFTRHSVDPSRIARYSCWWRHAAYYTWWLAVIISAVMFGAVVFAVLNPLALLATTTVLAIASGICRTIAHVKFWPERRVA